MPPAVTASIDTDKRENERDCTTCGDEYYNKYVREPVTRILNKLVNAGPYWVEADVPIGTDGSAAVIVDLESRVGDTESLHTQHPGLHRLSNSSTTA
jgi:hypothetical protein